MHKDFPLSRIIRAYFSQIARLSGGISLTKHFRPLYEEKSTLQEVRLLYEAGSRGCYTGFVYLAIVFGNVKHCTANATFFGLLIRRLGGNLSVTYSVRKRRK